MGNDKKSLPPKGFVTPERELAHAQILSNSVVKRFRHLAKRFRRENIDCFRLYDWDSPEIRIVVDWYAGHLVVAEYDRLQTGPHYLPRMASAVAEALDVPPDKVHLRLRRTKTGDEPRYTKLDSSGERFTVRERNLRLWVNCRDYLDTGLFSDHRDTRVIVGKLAAGKAFLNLFCYTGAFTCAAALGGANSTVSVDRSKTYIDWAQDNLALNGIGGPQHRLLQSDAMTYLSMANRESRRFNLALVDPPSYFHDEQSGSEFDIDRDHPQLLSRALAVMQPGGDLFFSTNHQRFEPRFAAIAVASITEITPQSIPEDYRNRRVHRCWQMRLP